MERIHESAVETAKKVRKALKSNFPGVKFSVTSSTYSLGSSVHVRWTDGPMLDEVNPILNQFESSKFDGMQDMKTTNGYMYDGKLYCGADYVTSSRELSADYRKKIEEKAAQMFPDFSIYAREAYQQMNKAEKELIGFSEKEKELEVTEALEKPIEPETVNNVIDFATKRAKKWEETLTPEQRLKMYVLNQMFDKEQVASLIASGYTIDEIFTIIANEACKENQIL